MRRRRMPPRRERAVSSSKPPLACAIIAPSPKTIDNQSLPTRLPLLIGVHVLVSALVEAIFAQQFGHHPRVIASHVLLVAEWDLALLLIVTAIAAFVPGDRWPGLSYRVLLAVTGTLQMYLYALS